jgi:hypothetical protein
MTHHNQTKELTTWFLTSTICISTRTIYSSISKTSSWKNCRHPTWSNNIASLTGCSKQQWVINEDHELDVWCLLVLTFNVWWMNNEWWSWTLCGGWTYRYMMPFGTYFLCMMDELCMMDNGCIYVYLLVMTFNGQWLYICLAFGTDFLWITTATDSNDVTMPVATKITVAMSN